MSETIGQASGEMTKPVIPGFCPVCGQWAFFAGVAPYRESFVCASCYSTSRYRRLALGVLEAFRIALGIDAPSLEHLPIDADRVVTLLDTQPPFSSPPYACYSMPTRLARYPWIRVQTSAYRPHLPWGSDLGAATTNQNLENLTYPDNSFDLVITSDVLEHVRLYERAHAEIVRVLRPNGTYIFTVPHSRSLTENLVRIATPVVDDPTQDDFVLPPEYHGSADPDEGPVLSFRVFGLNIDTELAALGLNVNYSVEPSPRHAIFETELFFCRRDS